LTDGRYIIVGHYFLDPVYLQTPQEVHNVTSLSRRLYADRKDAYCQELDASNLTLYPAVCARLITYSLSRRCSNEMPNLSVTSVAVHLGGRRSQKPQPQLRINRPTDTSREFIVYDSLAKLSPENNDVIKRRRSSQRKLIRCRKYCKSLGTAVVIWKESNSQILNNNLSQTQNLHQTLPFVDCYYHPNSRIKPISQLRFDYDEKLT